MIIVWIRDTIGFKIWCISGSENYRVNFYKYFCFIANFFPDTLLFVKFPSHQVQLNPNFKNEFWMFNNFMIN